MGDEARASDHACIALDRATRHRFNLYRGRAIVALVRVTTGRAPTSARALLDEAIALLQSCGAPPVLADALALRAQGWMVTAEQSCGILMRSTIVPAR